MKTKHWVISHQLSSKVDDTYYTIQNKYKIEDSSQGFFVYYSFDPNEALTFPDENATQKFITEKGLGKDSKAVLVEVDMDLNNKFELKFIKKQKDGILARITFRDNLALQRKEWDAAHVKEENRIKNKKCPCCKSPSKEHVLNYKHNGIFGPASHSTKIDDYYICKGCGVHYTDINKKDLGERP